MDWRIPLPKIRNINPTAATHNLQPVYYLQDPLQLSDRFIIIPQELGAIFMLCDGTRTLQMIRTALVSIFGIRVPENDLKELFLALDDAFLLDNRRSSEAQAKALNDFREAPSRAAAHAGISYPADPGELRSMLQAFITDESSRSQNGTIRGIISPHIDFARGGATYAAAWSPLKSSIDELDLVIIFGTDHHGNGETFTLTRQDYATPFGQLPTYQPGVDMLVDIFGEQSAFSGELRHRTEHSIEFAAVWLKFLCDGLDCPILPILCDGLPVREVEGQLRPGSDPLLQAAESALRELIGSRRTLIVAAGDLSHVGSAFSGEEVREDGLRALEQSDRGLIEPLESGDADEFHLRILYEDNPTNVCGTAPIVNTLHLLAPTSGYLTHYQQCLADSAQTSWVSICAMQLY